MGRTGRGNTVFQRFYRGKRVTARITGIGLYHKRNCQASGLSYDQKKRKGIDRNKSSFRIVRSLLNFVCILTAKEENINGKSDRAENIMLQTAEVMLDEVAMMMENFLQLMVEENLR